MTPWRALSPVAGLSTAQDASPTPTSLTEEEAAELDSQVKNLESELSKIEFLTGRLDTTEGLIQTLTRARLDRMSMDYFRRVVDLAQVTADHIENG